MDHGVGGCHRVYLAKIGAGKPAAKTRQSDTRCRRLAAASNPGVLLLLVSVSWLAAGGLGGYNSRHYELPNSDSRAKHHKAHPGTSFCRTQLLGRGRQHRGGRRALGGGRSRCPARAVDRDALPAEARFQPRRAGRGLPAQHLRRNAGHPCHHRGSGAGADCRRAAESR
jgi:hypothetical protein